MPKINLNRFKKLIENNAIAVATVNKNGKPHNIAVGYVKVVENDKIIITDVGMKETIENLKRNNNVALVVWNRNWERKCIGYEMKGAVKYFTSGKWKEFVDNLPQNKAYNPKGAILVTVYKIKKLT